MDVVLNSSNIICVVLFSFNEEAMPVSTEMRALYLVMGSVKPPAQGRNLVVMISESCFFLVDNKCIDG